jgi:hypothetical protein
MTYKYQTTLKLDEMQQTLRTVQKITQGMLGTPEAPVAGGGAIEPYFMCTYYDAKGAATPVKCDQATLAGPEKDHLCTRSGTVSTVHKCVVIVYAVAIGIN